VKQGVCAALEIVGGHYFIAGLGDIQQGQAYGRLPAGHCKAPAPPSRAAILFSKTSVVGFIRRV
jgi:hypothetical protein